jgi:hypothetical protein
VSFEYSLGRIGAPNSSHKSAGLAFALSLLFPGSGQIYCGKTTRGGIVLGICVLALTLLFGSAPPNVRGSGIVLALVLWVFSFLDAYFTAAEINAGQDAQVDVQNPRVAVILNLLTAGFGYFYLGERKKGMVIFAGTQILRFGVPRLTGFAGGVISLVLAVAQMLLAADAYRIARVQLREALGPEGVEARTSALKRSRLPMFVPITLACVSAAGFILLSVVGMAMNAARGH